MFPAYASADSSSDGALDSTTDGTVSDLALPDSIFPESSSLEVSSSEKDSISEKDNIFVGNASADHASENEKKYSVVIDASSNQDNYSVIIARMNRYGRPTSGSDASDSSPYAKGGSSELTAVLCRSDGSSVDYTSVSPKYIVLGPDDCCTLYFDSLLSAESAIAEMDQWRNIRYAELDGEVEACADGDYTFQSWGAEQMKYGVYLEYFTSHYTGASSTVAVVDSGVYSLHPTLTDRVRESGYDYIDDDHDATNDLYGHGTNVAGIIAECSQDAPVYIYPIRVLNSIGKGSFSNVVNAVREAAENGVNVINLSLSSKVMSEAMDEAVQDAVNAGIIVVIAAGNSAEDTASICPAHLDLSGAIVVGAVTAEGELAWYSNYGESVDLYTYGTDILCCSKSGGYVTNTGTSMAAPHISALSSLLLLLHPELTPAEVEQRIIAGTETQATWNVPNLQRMIPQRMPFNLENLRIDLSDNYIISFLPYCDPTSAMESVAYSSSDESVLSILYCDSYSEAGSLTNGLNSSGSASSAADTDTASAAPAFASENNCTVNGTCLLIPGSAGTATVTASSPFLDDFVFTVTVTDLNSDTDHSDSSDTDQGDSSDIGARHILKLPEQLTSLADESFSGDESLFHVILPNGIFSVGNNVFENCGNLSTVYLPAALTEIGSNTFSGAALLCWENSFAAGYAVEHNLAYIIYK